MISKLTQHGFSSLETITYLFYNSKQSMKATECLVRFAKILWQLCVQESEVKRYHWTWKNNSSIKFITEHNAHIILNLYLLKFHFNNQLLLVKKTAEIPQSIAYRAHGRAHKQKYLTAITVCSDCHRIHASALPTWI